MPESSVTVTFSIPDSTAANAWTTSGTASYGDQTRSFESGDGSPANGCLKYRYQSFYLAPYSDSNVGLHIQGTFEDWGVPTGSVINGIEFLNVNTKCVTYSNISSATTAICKLFYGGSYASNVTSYSGRSVTGTEGSWTSNTGSRANLTGTIASNSSARIAVLHNISYLYFQDYEDLIDQVSVKIYYDSAAGYTGSASLTRNHQTSTASGTRSLPVFTGTATGTRHPTISSAATYSGPLVYSGTSSVGIVHTASGVAYFGPPRYSGTTTSQIVHTISSGGYTLNNTLGMYIRGVSAAEWLANMTMFTSGSSTSTSTKNSQMTLYSGAPEPKTRTINLVIKTDALPTPTNAFALSVFGGQGVMRNGITLFTFSDDDPVIKGSMNMFIDGTIRGSADGVMNLVVEGGNPRALHSLPLIVRSNPFNEEYVDLYISGGGIAPGYYPTDNSVNMHVARGPEAGMDFFLCNKELENSTHLFVYGQPWSSTSTTLFVRGEGGTADGQATLAIPNVVVPVSINASQNLLVPNVVGYQQLSTKLFIRGFQI